MIKRTMISLLSLSALALLFVASPVLANEVDVEAENTTTGADSDNNNDFDIDNDLDVDQDNNANVNNTASASVETGNNKQNKNTKGGDLETGMVDASTDWETAVNNGATLMGASDGGLDVSADFSNDTTGADSDNDNDLDVDNDTDLDLDNVANILNSLGLTANTGDNEQNKNTMGGDLASGGVSVDSAIMNEANNDSGFYGSANGGLTVDVDGSNHKTGADSDNDNDFDIDNDVDYNVNNTANLTSVTSVNANTGGNKQNKNTQGGSVKSGDVEVKTDVHNSANNGGSVAGAGNSGLDVSADLSNDTTGADSDNDNDLDVDNDVDVDVDNTANVNNTVGVSANTGDNQQNKNTEGGNVETGSVSIDFSSHTEANNN